MKQLCNRKVSDFDTASRVQKLFGTFEKLSQDQDIILWFSERHYSHITRALLALELPGLSSNLFLT